MRDAERVSRAGLFTVLGVLLAVACSGPLPRQPGCLPAISGMAPLDTDSWLVVHDGRLAADVRVGVLRSGPDGTPVYSPLPADFDERLGESLADLEAVAAVPGRDGDFLLLESGSTPNGAPPHRRLAQVHVDAHGDTIALIASTDISAATAKLANCEGLLCWRHQDRLRVLIADRGQADAPAAYRVGTIEVATSPDGRMQCTLDDPAPELGTLLGTTTGAGARACADLLLDANGTVWSLSTIDPGVTGPFCSALARVGAIDAASGWPRLQAPQVACRFDGFKVEAIAERAAGHLWIASDDEAYGGTLRPLPTLRY